MKRRGQTTMSSNAPATSETPLLPRPSASTLLSYDEVLKLDPWRADNHYILTGYRRTLNSYWLCFKSIFSVHNETVNIWTHLVGSAVALLSLAYALSFLSAEASQATGRRGWMAPFAGIPFPFPSADHPSVQWIDAAGFGIFFISAATCLGFSATFHALTCHSMKVAHQWNKCDYVGIVILISGTFVPCVRYGFFCDPHLRNLYITLIYVAAAFTAVTVLSPHARTPEYRRFRAWVFIALGASAVFPVAHGILRYGLEEASRAIALPWLALGGLLYIAGAVLYAERCPERFAPGRFDLFGTSHQIFHVMILFAAYAHWCAIAEGFRYWHEERLGVCAA
ncbi:hemolysin-III related-domain-containing protein [Leucosporidium creatinivorum]|uniref:Hemolysin-III related-domain-containing protein n=1 Tax=Leucosporidium creatinivorum TaxID=106004 RepID=A0A1Y2EPA1_9BASI|nr:hemolysin-III related-domain-containing protein [Leucosporidium creatinivorum]